MASSILILAGIHDIDTTNADAIRNAPGSRLIRAYDETFSDSDSYATCLCSLVLGKDDPEAIRQAAREWNDEIRKNLKTAIAEWLQHDEQLELYTHGLAKAAAAADGDIHPYAQTMLYDMVNVGGMNDDVSDRSLSAILRPHHLAHIEAHPELYALAELAVK